MRLGRGADGLCVRVWRPQWPWGPVDSLGCPPHPRRSGSAFLRRLLWGPKFTVGLGAFMPDWPSVTVLGALRAQLWPGLRAWTGLHFRDLSTDRQASLPAPLCLCLCLCLPSSLSLSVSVSHFATVSGVSTRSGVLGPPRLCIQTSRTQDPVSPRGLLQASTQPGVSQTVACDPVDVKSIWWVRIIFNNVKIFTHNETPFCVWCSSTKRDASRGSREHHGQAMEFAPGPQTLFRASLPPARPPLVSSCFSGRSKHGICSRCV